MKTGFAVRLKVVRHGASPTTLEFMLKANSDPKNPYLLLLDEMNLAHVERYFADVLSGMESQQPCLPNLVKEDDGCWRIGASQQARIALPGPYGLSVQ